METTTMNIKFNLNNQNRMFNLANLSYSSLLSAVQESFQLPPDSLNRLKVTYFDTSDDIITVSSDEEILSALKYNRELNPVVFFGEGLAIGDNHVENGDKKGSRNDKKAKNSNKKKAKFLDKIGNEKLYTDCGIGKEDIPLFKEALVGLYDVGCIRLKFNLRLLKKNRVGNNLEEAIKMVRQEEDNRKRRLAENREKRVAKKGAKRKDDDDMNVDDKTKEKMMNKKLRDDARFLEIDSWEEGKFLKIFVDGNNLLFLTANLRNNTLGKIRKSGRKNRSEDILREAIGNFSGYENGLRDMMLIFDSTRTNDEVVLENGVVYKICSAAPQFRSSDDALVVFGEQIDVSMREACLFVTSDRALAGRLSNLGVKVIKPKLFFQLVIKKLQGDGIGIDDWFESIENKLMNLGSDVIEFDS